MCNFTSSSNDFVWQSSKLAIKQSAMVCTWFLRIGLDNVASLYIRITLGYEFEPKCLLIMLRCIGFLMLGGNRWVALSLHWLACWVVVHADGSSSFEELLHPFGWDFSLSHCQSLPWLLNLLPSQWMFTVWAPCICCLFCIQTKLYVRLFLELDLFHLCDGREDDDK